MKHRGFTLIEMLVATVLASVLIYAVLNILAGVSRDRRLLSHLETSSPGLVDLVRWDLSNAETMNSMTDGSGLVLIGHGGIDRATLLPNGRLARITYTLSPAAGDQLLLRRQEYLDDPSRVDAWTELVAGEVSEFLVRPSSGDPSKMHLHVVMKTSTIDQEMWTQ